MLFEILDAQVDIDKPFYEQVCDKKISAEKIDSEIKTLHSKYKKTPKEMLRLIAYHLVYPIPEQRWKAKTFLDAITKAHKRLNGPRWMSATPTLNPITRVLLT